MASGTLVFVHGTGVRSPGYVDLKDLVERRLASRGPAGVHFVSCGWGDQVGVKLDGLEQSLPPEERTKGAGDIGDWDSEVALWGMLLDDPLFELRVVMETGAPTTGVVVNTLLPSQQLSNRLVALDLSKLPLDGTGLDAKVLGSAIQAVVGSQEFTHATEAAKDVADPDMARAVARAIVATAISAQREAKPRDVLLIALTPALRDSLVEALEKTISGATTKSVVGWIKKKVMQFAKNRATAAFRSHRADLTGLGLAGVGDVLYYQRRGGPIASVVRQALENASPPVVAVGHSLGGIILVDLLSGADAPKVDLLITVGSQAPLFYVVDALENVRRVGGRRPFTPWRNIYNRNDFLSYCALPLLKDYSDIIDEPVDPGVPFPDSHSAYWNNDRVYDLIKGWWPKGNGG